MIDLPNEQKAILINRAVTKDLNPDAPMKDSGVDCIIGAGRGGRDRR
ncbi:MAG: hypothetical protein OXC91_08705 [Rhodobacteraceae bacterium]|nr:hypothetical protein [Paracoccaceae bacterium]